MGGIWPVSDLLEDRYDLGSTESTILHGHSRMDAAYRPCMKRMGDDVLPPMTVDYSKEIEESEVWVAESEGSLVGVIVVLEEEDKFQIANIAVHPESQGRGVGKALISLAIEEAKNRQHDTVELVTHPLLEENLSLYTHLGWLEIGRDDSHVYMARAIK